MSGERGMGEAARVWTRRRLLREAGVLGRGVLGQGVLRAGVLGTGMRAGVGWADDLPKPKDLPKLKDLEPGKGTGASGGVQTNGPGSLKAHAEARGLLMGCAVDVARLEREEMYRRVLVEQFNCVVGENCMKWGQIHPAVDRYDFAEADALVGFAEQHGMKVRGHNLCWHESLPDWFAGTVTRANARQVLEDHIRTVAGRYRGRIHSWDVVNEAVWPKDGRPDGLRQAPWLELIGPEYVELAFRVAREADPGAVLLLNDYGVEYDTPEEQQKRGYVVQLVERLQRAGAPIGGVGVQSHLRTGDVTKLGDGIRRFAKDMGKRRLQVVLTELDVNDDGLPDEPVEQQDRDVATVYAHYLREVLGERAVTGVLVWGLADGQSYLQGERWRTKQPGRAERPLLLSEVDGVYSAKPAFYAVRAALDGAKRR